jgi:predicted ATPase/DNA-binding winged helix-turn-helix (wHTH) protein
MPAATGSIPEFRFGHVVVEPRARRVLIGNEPARVGARAFDVLQALIEHRERVVGKDELLARVWPGMVVEENNLEVHISSLRKVLGAQVIATVPGRGYRFTAPVDAKNIDDIVLGTGFAREPAGNLPSSLPTLHGRDADLARLQSLVQSHRLVTLTGPCGVGKTRLALAVARSLQHHFAQGAWVADLEDISDPSLLATTVARAAGLSPLEPHELPARLRGRHMLLVLDNCEHMVSAVSRLAQALVAQAPPVHVVVTSQELLRAQGERLFRLQPLTVARQADPEQALASGAVALFVDRVESLLPGFELTGQQVADVIEICRRLDGLPLAIEMAAARVPLLGIAGLRQRLDERFQVLRGGARPTLRRHQTLRKAMDWSYGLLNAGERAVFRRAAVFVGGFTLGDAQRALAGEGLDEWDVLDHLGSLVDKSLVMADSNELPCYRMLETVQAYALDKLREAGESEPPARRSA